MNQSWVFFIRPFWVEKKKHEIESLYNWLLKSD